MLTSLQRGFHLSMLGSYGLLTVHVVFMLLLLLGIPTPPCQCDPNPSPACDEGWGCRFLLGCSFFTHRLRYLARFLPATSASNFLVPVSKTAEPLQSPFLYLVLSSSSLYHGSEGSPVEERTPPKVCTWFQDPCRSLGSAPAYYPGFELHFCLQYLRVSLYCFQAALCIKFFSSILLSLSMCLLLCGVIPVSALSSILTRSHSHLSLKLDTIPSLDFCGLVSTASCIHPTNTYYLQPLQKRTGETVVSKIQSLCPPGVYYSSWRDRK